MTLPPLWTHNDQHSATKRPRITLAAKTGSHALPPWTNECTSKPFFPLELLPVPYLTTYRRSQYQEVIVTWRSRFPSIHFAVQSARGSACHRYFSTYRLNSPSDHSEFALQMRSYSKWFTANAVVIPVRRLFLYYFVHFVFSISVEKPRLTKSRILEM